MEHNRPKKLVLTRETVRDLTHNEMRRAEGGVIQMTNAGNCATKPRNCETVSGLPCKVC